MLRLARNLAILAVILLLIKAPFALVQKDPLESNWREFNAGYYNAVFVGSSRTEAGVIASVFDTAADSKTRSYNFGVSGGMPPETFAWCERMILEKKSLKYLFVELSGDSNDLPLDMFPARAYRVSTYFEWLPRLPLNSWSDYHNRFVVSLLKPPVQIAPGKGVSQINHPNQIADSLTRNQMVDRSSQKLLSDQESYSRNINDLITLAEANGVVIYFFIPPRIETDRELQTIERMYETLDVKYKIDGGHADPSLYTPEVSFDEFHLNPNGASIFSAGLAQAFKEKTKPPAN